MNMNVPSYHLLIVLSCLILCMLTFDRQNCPDPCGHRFGKFLTISRSYLRYPNLLDSFSQALLWCWIQSTDLLLHHCPQVFDGVEVRTWPWPWLQNLGCPRRLVTWLPLRFGGMGLHRVGILSFQVCPCMSATCPEVYKDKLHHLSWYSWAWTIMHHAHVQKSSPKPSKLAPVSRWERRTVDYIPRLKVGWHA